MSLDDPTHNSSSSSAGEPRTESEGSSCPICGFINPPDRLLCTKCQAVLNMPVYAATTKLPPDPIIPGVAKWGTTYIEKRLFFQFRNSSQPLEVILREGEIIVGRVNPDTGEHPDVDLAAFGAADAGVSRKHVCLTFDNNVVRVSDLNSANFTYLNGYKLIPHQPRILRDGDELRLGQLVLRVQFGEKRVES